MPLGLSDTYFPAPGDTGLRAPFAHGYEVVDGNRKDATVFNASAAGMAGSLVTTNEDTSAFITALLDGRVVPPAQLREMMNTVDWTDARPGFHYGLALTGIDLECGVMVWGHGGDIDGYHSLMAKGFAGPAVSIAFAQSPPETDSLASDPRAEVLNGLLPEVGAGQPRAITDSNQRVSQWIMSRRACQPALHSTRPAVAQRLRRVLQTPASATNASTSTRSVR